MVDKQKKFDSDDPDILAAYQAETEGRFCDAVAHYKKVIERNPDVGIVYKHCGNVYYRIGKLKEAEEYLKKACELMPHFPLRSMNLHLHITVK